MENKKEYENSNDSNLWIFAIVNLLLNGNNDIDKRLSKLEGKLDILEKLL